MLEKIQRLRLSMQFFAEDDFETEAESGSSDNLFDDENIGEETPGADETENSKEVAAAAAEEQKKQETQEQALALSGDKLPVNDELYELELLDSYAASLGMSRGEYIAQLANSQKQQYILEQMEAGVPEEAANELYELKKSNEQLMQKECHEKEKLEEKQKYIELFEEYPDLKEIPQEVFADIMRGEKPINAYRIYENKKLKEEIKILKQNSINAKSTIGSVKGDAPTADADSFMQGFDSVL